jgi:hypothetical protein
MRIRRVTLPHDTCDGVTRLCGRSRWALVPRYPDLSPNGVLLPRGRRPSGRGLPAWMSRPVNALAAIASSIFAYRVVGWSISVKATWPA